MNTVMPVLPRKRTASAARESGFTLIEMMISITIGLGILAGLVGVLATNSSNSRSNDRTSELMTNGRYALNSMKREVREAGFRAYTWAEPIAPGALGALTNECLEAGAAAGSFVSNIRQGVWGSNNPPLDPFAGSCIPAGNFAANNDVLVVRRLAPVATPTASLAANAVYFQSSYGVGQIYRSTATPVTPPPFTGSPTPLASFALQVYVYYISPFSVSATENPLVPALYRVSLLADGSMRSEMVASGIEHMQVQYGSFTTSALGYNTQYLDTVVGSSSATASTDWDNVRSVRIWLLARNSTPEPGYSNTNTYAMGDQSYAVNDAYRRQLFTTVVQLRNKE